LLSIIVGLAPEYEYIANPVLFDNSLEIINGHVLLFLISIPASLLFLIMLFETIGLDPDLIKKPSVPFSIVNPLKIEVESSPLLYVTTAPSEFPSIIVDVISFSSFEK